MLYLHNFTEVYEKQNFYKKFAYKIFENKKLSGVRGYMDEESGKYLLNEIKHTGELSALHFLDSGNYHHLSRLYIDLIKHPFDLVVYDNHTDMQFSAFGNILSCGSWIADAYKSCENIHNIIIIGANEQYIQDCEFRNDNKIIFTDSIFDVKIAENTLPIYISVDKDVLSVEEFVSDWDQGKMSLGTLADELHYLAGNFNILGVDVCGEPVIDDEHNIRLSNNINKELANIFVDILYEI